MSLLSSGYAGDSNLLGKEFSFAPVSTPGVDYSNQGYLFSGLLKTGTKLPRVVDPQDLKNAIENKEVILINGRGYDIDTLTASTNNVYVPVFIPTYIRELAYQNKIDPEVFYGYLRQNGTPEMVQELDMMEKKTMEVLEEIVITEEAIATAELILAAAEEELAEKQKELAEKQGDLETALAEIAALEHQIEEFKKITANGGYLSERQLTELIQGSRSNLGLTDAEIKEIAESTGVSFTAADGTVVYVEYISNDIKDATGGTVRTKTEEEGFVHLDFRLRQDIRLETEYNLTIVENTTSNRLEVYNMINGGSGEYTGVYIDGTRDNNGNTWTIWTDQVLVGDAYNGLDMSGAPTGHASGYDMNDIFIRFDKSYTGQLLKNLVIDVYFAGFHNGYTRGWSAGYIYGYQAGWKAAEEAYGIGE